jgi:hypothetical protein
MAQHLFECLVKAARSWRLLCRPALRSLSLQGGGQLDHT